MKKLFLTVALSNIILLFFSSQLLAQKSPDMDRVLYRADNLFNIKNYKAAVPLYLEAVNAGVNDPVVFYRLGKGLAEAMEVNEQLKSIPYLEKALNSNHDKIPSDIHYYLGKMYHRNIDIEKAIHHFEVYKKTIPASDKSKLKDVNYQLELCNNALYLVQNRKNIIINRLESPINSEFTEYNPVIAADESVMAYTALRPNSDRSSNVEFVEEIYITYKDKNKGQWSQPKQVKVNTKFNVGTAGISPDGHKMLIFIGGLNNTGSIYSIEKSGKDWTTPTLFGNNVNSKYLETTASITPDGKTIYFASDRPGGFGGLDIYKVVQNEDGSWSKPMNLGPEINTAEDEDAPFIHPDQRTLFFTSTGHNSMGGRDIFKTVLIGGKWKKPENMGFPINTPNNDNYFTLTADGSKGYFSSDRPGGAGGQDIYSFDMPEDEANIPLTMVKGRILSGDKMEPVPTKIKVVDKSTDTKVDYVYNPNKDGNYLIIFPPGKNYDMIIESEGYMPYTLNINVPNQNYFYELYQQIHLKQIKHFDVVVGQEVSVKNAFFDTNEETRTEVRKTNEAMLVQNDSLDIYALMDDIIAAGDTHAYDYLLELMYSVNPVDNIDFDKVESVEQMEAAKRVYYYDESDETTLEAKVVGGETIYSLPTMYVAEEAKLQKEKKKVVEASYDKSLLKPVHKVYFDPDKSELKPAFHENLNGVLDALRKHDNLGIEIVGFASPDGDPEYNRKLSNKRAIEVLNYFNHKGVVRRRIVAKGLGATSTDTSNKIEDRRVEIRIVDLNNL
jgi:outer membrane protein OmpA-like peptidoglycan-associated protein/tetratricopeptide (TPR) repeat protein